MLCITNLTKKLVLKTAFYIDHDLSFADEFQSITDTLGFKLVHTATVDKFKQHLNKLNPALIIAEMDLPDGDGISLCQEIRKNKELSKVPFILVSAKSDIYIQVLAYESGADEYMIKPLNKRLVISRLRSLLRRSEGNVGSIAVKHPDLVINREKFTVEYRGKEINLPRKEFEILFLLYTNKGIVYNRDRIKEEIWQNKGSGVNSRTIDVHIKNIREIIGARFIKTIKGVGYKYAG